MKLLDKYKDIGVEVKASIWYTICNFFQKGISFVVVPIYVRLLTTAEYGDWSVFQSWRDILIIFASLNLYAGVYTKTLVDNKDDRDRYTASMQGLGTTITVVLFVVYIFTHKWCEKAIGLDTAYMLLLFLYFIVYPAFSFWGSRQRVEYNYKAMVAVTVVLSLLTPALSIILLQTTGLRANALILGYLIVQCIVGLYFYILQFWKGRCFYNKKYWRYALKYNIPLVPHYLSLIVLGQSDRIMIKYFCGNSEAGIYSFAYQIASAISVLIASINGSRVPWTYEQFKKNTLGSLKKTTNLLTLLMASVTLLVSLLSPEVIAILGTSDYAVAEYVIPVVVLGIFYTFVYDLYASVEFYFGATRYVMYASLIGAVLNIILNAVFIPIFGFIAAAYSTLVCYLVFMIMHYLFSRRVLSEQKLPKSVYDDRIVFGISLLVTILCLGSMLTFNYPVIRILLVAMLVVICVMKRESIKALLTSMRK